MLIITNYYVCSALGYVTHLNDKMSLHTNHKITYLNKMYCHLLFSYGVNVHGYISDTIKDFNMKLYRCIDIDEENCLEYKP